MNQRITNASGEFDWEDEVGDDCNDYANCRIFGQGNCSTAGFLDGAAFCDEYGEDFYNEGYTASGACCVCGGGYIPPANPGPDYTAVPCDDDSIPVGKITGDVYRCRGGGIAYQLHCTVMVVSQTVEQVTMRRQDAHQLPLQPPHKLALALQLLLAVAQLL